MSGRTPVDAKRAQRLAIERARGCTLTESRVLLGLVALVTLYDRTEDRVSNQALCNVTGMSARAVAKGAQLLEARGVVEREVGGTFKDGGRIATLYRFPTPDSVGSAPTVTPDCGVSAPLTPGSVTPDSGVPLPRFPRDTSEVQDTPDSGVIPGWENPHHKIALDGIRRHLPHLDKQQRAS